MADWYGLKFLESPSNLKGVLKRVVGRQPSSKVAGEIATCLQQGRLFFDAAQKSPLEIRPLQLFYGIVGFSKALAAARQVSSIDTLDQTHGLEDKSNANSKLQELTVSIGNRGTFQHFNDAICGLERIRYFGNETEPKTVFKSASSSSSFQGKNITLKDILARQPSLSDVYQATFNEQSCCGTLSFFHQDSVVDLRIDWPAFFHNRESLKSIVRAIRGRYPFLESWALSTADRAWGNSVIIFVNRPNAGEDEFSEDRLPTLNNGFVAKHATDEPIAFDSILPPLAGGISSSHPVYIAPYEGEYLSEFSSMYLASFLLSSVVRYRPQIWVSAISGRGISERGADDQCVALVEKFLDVALTTFPSFVLNSIETKLP